MRVTLLLICITLIFSCKKNNDEACKSDYFACTVDTKCFAPSTISDVHAIFYTSPNELSIDVTSATFGKMIITLPQDSTFIHTATYTMGEVKAKAAYQADVNNPSTYYFTKTALGGTLSITSVDTSTKRIKGSFCV
jgi:hypothetical protein